MPIQVQAPDGSVVEFPDGTDDATITQVMRQEYPGGRTNIAADAPFEARTAPGDAPAGMKLGVVPRQAPVAVAPLAPVGVPRKSGVAEDMAKSAAFSGLPRAVTGTFGGAGDMFELSQMGADWLAHKTGVDARPAMRNATKNIPVIGDFVRKATGDGNLFVTSGQLNDKVQSVTGDYYKPQTTPGRYSEQAAEFIGNAATPGGWMKRTAAVLVPAVASQALGDGAEAMGLDEGGQAGAEFVGALLGGGAVAGGPRMANGAKRLMSGAAEGGERLTSALAIPRKQAKITPSATRRAEDVVAEMAARKGVTPQTIAADPRVQKGAVGAQLLGREGVMTATALGRRSGQTADLLEGVLRPQLDARGQALADDLGAAAGLDPAAAFDDFAAQAAAGRKAAGPKYEAAYAVEGVDSPELRQLLATDAGRKALARAVRIASNDLRTPEEIGLVARETDQPSMFGGKLAEDIEVRNPSMETWDYVKRALDDEVEGFRDGTTRKLNLNEEGRGVLNVGTKLRQELVARNPLYGEALAAGGEPIRLEQAFRDSAKLFGPNVRVRDFNIRFDKMGAAERKAAVAGLVDDVVGKAENGRLRPKDYQTPAFRQKLEKALGPEQAARFLEDLRVRNDLAATGQRMLPGTNSTTGEVSEAVRDMDRSGGIVGDIERRIQGGQAPWRAAPEAVVRGLVADPVAGVLRGMQAPHGRAVRDELGRILSSPEELAAALENHAARNAGRPPRVGNGSKAVPRLAAPGIAAALGGSAPPNEPVTVDGREVVLAPDGTLRYRDTGEPVG